MTGKCETPEHGTNIPRTRFIYTKLGWYRYTGI